MEQAYWEFRLSVHRVTEKRTGNLEFIDALLQPNEPGSPIMRRKMKQHLHGVFKVSWNCLQVMTKFPFNYIGDYRYRCRYRYRYRYTVTIDFSQNICNSLPRILKIIYISSTK